LVVLPSLRDRSGVIEQRWKSEQRLTKEWVNPEQGPNKVPIRHFQKDAEVIRYFKEIETLPSNDKAALLRVISAFIRDVKTSLYTLRCLKQKKNSWMGYHQLSKILTDCQNKSELLTMTIFSNLRIELSGSMAP
jgi:hypothetical protein